jgi:large subunit ribosomal protein L6
MIITLIKNQTKNMAQEKMEEKINVPEGFSAEIKIEDHDEFLTIKGKGKENTKKFVLHNILLEVKGNEIIISAERNRRNEKKVIGSVVAHINKMILGLKENFVYKMEICNVHFPMTVKVEGKELVIKNFLGEKVSRIAKIKPGTDVDVKGNIIILSSHDKDAAGETASNIELATKIRNRDRRVFQDGIFLIEKPAGERK